MKKGVMIAIVLFLAGIFSAQLFGSEFLSTYGFLNEYHMQMFAGSKMDHMDLFWNILWERGKFFLFMVLLLATPVRKILPDVTLGIGMYGLGLYAAACVLCMGIKGLGFFFFSLFPQWIFYILVLFFLFRLQKPAIYEHHGMSIAYIGSMLALLILFVAGCIVEATIGMWMLLHFLAL